MLCVQCPWPVAPVHRGARSVCCLCRLCRVLGDLVPVHRCVRSVCGVGCAVSLATSLLFTGAPARCVVLPVRCPWPVGFFSPLCPLGVLCCVCDVLGHLAPVHRCAHSVRCACDVLILLGPVHRCARSLCCVACAVSLATWLLFTVVPARCAVLRVWCPWPLGSCSPVCPLGVFFCVCSVLGHLAPVHRCARSGCCACPVLGLLAPVHRCPRSVCSVGCAVSLATWLLFTGVPAQCVDMRLRCSWPLASCSPVCLLGALCVPCRWPPGFCSPVPLLGVLCCVCGVLDHLAPNQWCARSVCCPCGVLGHLAPGHRCACSVCCVACSVSFATPLPFTVLPAHCAVCVVSLTTWLLFTGVLTCCVVLCVRCPWPIGSRSPMGLLAVLCVRSPWPLGFCSRACPLGVLCCVCCILGHLAPLHRSTRSVCCVPCAVSSAGWLPLMVRPRPVCYVYGVAGHWALVLRCTRSVCCDACAVSLATRVMFSSVHARCAVRSVSLASRLLFSAVPARCVVLRLPCPWPFGSCSPVRPLGVLCCAFGVSGHLAPVH